MGIEYKGAKKDSFTAYSSHKLQLSHNLFRAQKDIQTNLKKQKHLKAA